MVGRSSVDSRRATPVPFSDSTFQFREPGFRKWAVKLPLDEPIAIEQCNVSVVWDVEPQGLLQLFLAMQHDQKTIALLFWDATFDTVNRHAADQPGRVL